MSIKITEGLSVIAPWLKAYLGFKSNVPDDIVQKEWKRRTEHICKPCLELKYCPYGPIVEQFPLNEDESAKAEELGWYAKLIKGKGWVPCDKKDEGAIPDTNRVIEKFGQLNEHSCAVFGHICPVFFVNEPLTETVELRKVTRSISRKMFLRIVRRDNQTCQICGKILKDAEIKIDHIIPFSKGGPTEESNLRVLCEDCNRKKGASIED
jgi:hypothetical protein